MTKVVENPLSRALQASSQMLLGMMIQKRRLDLDERAEDRLKAKDDALFSLQRLGVLGSQLPQDITLAEAPDLYVSQFKDAFGLPDDVDPRTDPRFMNMNLNPTTEADKLGETFALGMREAIESMSPAKRTAFMRDNAFFRAQGRSASVSEFEDAFAEIRRLGLETLRQEDYIDIGRNQVGLPLEVRAILHNGSEVTFESAESARITIALAQLAQQEASSSASLSIENRRLMNDLAKSTAEDINNLGIGLKVTGATVLQSMQMSAEEIAQLPADDPLRRIREFQAHGMQSLNGALDYWLANIEGGEQYAFMFDALERFAETVPREDVIQLAEDLTNQLVKIAEAQGHEGIIPIIKARSGFFGMGGPEIGFRAPISGASGAQSTSFSNSGSSPGSFGSDPNAIVSNIQEANRARAPHADVDLDRAQHFSNLKSENDLIAKFALDIVLGKTTRSQVFKNNTLDAATRDLIRETERRLRELQRQGVDLSTLPGGSGGR